MKNIEERLDALETSQEGNVSIWTWVGLIFGLIAMIWIAGYTLYIHDPVDVNDITTNAAAQASTGLRDSVLSDLRKEIPSLDLLKEEILQGLPKSDNSLLKDEVAAYKQRLDTLERTAVEKDGVIASLRQEIEAIKARSPVASNVVVQQPQPGTVVQSLVSPATVVAGRDSNSRVVDQYFGVKSEPQGLEWAPFDPRLGAQLPFQKTAKGIHLIGVGPTENPGPPFPMAAEATHEWVDVTAGVARVFPQLSREIEGGHKFWGRRPKSS